MTDTPKPKTTITDELYGTRTALFQLLGGHSGSGAMVLPDPAEVSMTPVRRVEPPSLIPARPRKALRKAKAADAADPDAALLRDSFIFRTLEDSGNTE